MAGLFCGAGNSARSRLSGGFFGPRTRFAKACPTDDIVSQARSQHADAAVLMRSGYVNVVGEQSGQPPLSSLRLRPNQSPGAWRSGGIDASQSAGPRWHMHPTCFEPIVDAPQAPSLAT